MNMNVYNDIVLKSENNLDILKELLFSYQNNSNIHNVQYNIIISHGCFYTKDINNFLESICSFIETLFKVKLKTSQIPKFLLQNFNIKLSLDYFEIMDKILKPIKIKSINLPTSQINIFLLLALCFSISENNSSVQLSYYLPNGPFYEELSQYKFNLILKNYILYREDVSNDHILRLYCALSYRQKCKKELLAYFNEKIINQIFSYIDELSDIPDIEESKLNVILRNILFTPGAH